MLTIKAWDPIRAILQIIFHPQVFFSWPPNRLTDRAEILPGLWRNPWRNFWERNLIESDQATGLLRYKDKIKPNFTQATYLISACNNTVPGPLGSEVAELTLSHCLLSADPSFCLLFLSSPHPPMTYVIRAWWTSFTG